MKTRTEITFEMDRLVIVGTRGGNLQWCDTCHKRVDMMTTDQAAIMARVTSRTIFRWAESDRLHSSETPEGLLLICPNSL
ncbi:MAG TPA: hypothetical protein VF074_19790 [Pyrinomonadaceae bacterium]